MVIAYIIILHFLADFFISYKNMMLKRHEEPQVLFHHISIHYIVFSLGLLPIYGMSAIWAAFLNCAIHAVIDWNIWTYYKYSVVWRNPTIPLETLKSSYKYWEDKWFYINLGFDQLLHGLTLVFVYYLLNGGNLIYNPM